MPTYNYLPYKLYVKDQRSLDGFSEDGAITSGCMVFVYDAGTKTLSTIYSDVAGTALANPITRAQFASYGLIKFFGAAASYDMFVAHSDGSCSREPGITPNTHSVKLNRGGTDKCLVFPMLGSVGNVETDTGLDVPYKAHVYDVAVEVTTVQSGKTVDMGLLSSETAGNAAGFISAISVATAGFVKPVVATAGGNETYVSTAKYGVLLGPVLVGTDVDKDNGIGKGYGHVVDGANATSVTYTPSSSSTSWIGYGYLYFKHLR